MRGGETSILRATDEAVAAASSATPHAEIARQARSAVLIAGGGLALFAAFTSIIAWTGWFRIAWQPVAVVLLSLVTLNLMLARFTEVWARTKLAAWIYEGVHAVAFTVILHYCGGLQMGIAFLVFAFLVVHTEMLRADASPFVTANVAALCYAALAVAEELRIVEPVHVLDVRLTTAESAVIVVFGFLSANFLALYANRSGHQLRTFATRLQHMVRERTAELRKKAMELEALNAQLARRVDEKVGELARMHALKRYLPAPLVDQVMQGRLSVSGAHDRVRLAALVVRFRVAGAEDAPEDTATAVNALLDAALAEAHARGGVVDRITPAGLSVLFGAPVPRPLQESAVAAAEAGRTILETMDSIERALAAEGVVARLDASAGLATGVATVGNFGSADRMEYMALGPVVDQAWDLACGEAGQLSVDETTRTLVPSLAGEATLAVRSGSAFTALPTVGGASNASQPSASRALDRASRRRDVDGPLAIGDLVDDRYEVLGVLGAGAMGVVYRVRHVELTCLRALKVIYPHLLSNPEAVRRLRGEAEALSRLSHSHIVHFYDFARTAQGDRYLAMELVDGPTLGKVIGGRAMPLAQARLIADEMLQALEAAHAQGIVHRDLKPANVLVSQGIGCPQSAKVADFGLARILSGEETSGAFGALGTPAYMSPEQCRGESGDERADLYSFGVILFEMLTGRRPFHSERLEGWFAAHLHQEAPDPREFHALPDAWAHLVLATLEKDPDARPRSATELREALARTVAEPLGDEGTARLELQNEKAAWLRSATAGPARPAPVLEPRTGPTATKQRGTSLRTHAPDSLNPASDDIASDRFLASSRPTDAVPDPGPVVVLARSR